MVSSNRFEALLFTVGSIPAAARIRRAIIRVRLMPQNSSIAETSRRMAQLEREMLAGNPAVEHWSTYVGRGALRLILSFDVQPAAVK
jgi:multidrug efflux pump subunit AcrB